jgi:Domain of unknown function (DUF4440)/Domain of unknown function (DUF3471)
VTRSSSLLLTVLLCLMLFPSSCTEKRTRITQEELERRTQELMDSVAVGDQGPWKKYVADDAMIFDEKGRSMDKAALVNDVQPLPKGYSGVIKLVKAQSRMFGDTAILSYEVAETETIYGQNLAARYHGTDTWAYRNGSWQIVASQMLRYYEDPAPGKVAPSQFQQYAGTYQLAPGITMRVSVDGDKLYAQRGDRPKEQLIPESPDLFFRKAVEGRRLFRRGNNGKVDALIDRRNNEDVVWMRVG